MAQTSSLFLLAATALAALLSSPAAAAGAAADSQGGKLARTQPRMPKPKLPPFGLGFDIYCPAVCRHIFEVAGKRTWDFRDDYERVEADLKDFCATAPEFQDPSTTGHQTCPVLIPRDVGRIAEVIHRYAGKGEEPGDGPESVEVAIKSAAIGICYEVHEACNRYGRAPNVYGDLEKLREEYPGVKQPEPAAKPKPRDEGPQKGPPKISAEKAKTLLKKRRARSVEL
eukprot:CAMPEP_0117652288 /NCGR_PEP_ID=MMETSP0804-20121206/2547_1 /TAXON_ID=1074897 /ORGANISM="Tetraselmis astigmatica, Strain CCMP880" /LENGTH=226 /DNA_ID=CAMNT_0005458325 /DNA_START=277 /DNA_END=957 /DNA_ORIENTATION=+